ncbi:MAG: DUF4833 domain-containing protein [Saprospiraceae bacterium]|nr:DUF4833 domain-containing protein [Saprospiraceae bacterium]
MTLSAQDMAKSVQMTLMSRPSDFPVPPSSNKTLFFIQRNKNKHTIVYDAKMQNGKLDASNPIDNYWLRYYSYDMSGQRKELSWAQQNFAYGYNSKKDATGKGHYITLTAYDKRKIYLSLDAKGNPIATMTINGKTCRLNHIWVFGDDSGTWPKVFHIDLHGTELASGKKQTERINND